MWGKEGAREPPPARCAPGCQPSIVSITYLQMFNLQKVKNCHDSEDNDAFNLVRGPKKKILYFFYLLNAFDQQCDSVLANPQTLEKSTTYFLHFPLFLEIPKLSVLTLSSV